MKKLIIIFVLLISSFAFGQITRTQVVMIKEVTEVQRDGLTIAVTEFPIIYNTTSNQHEKWDGSAWGVLGGAEIATFTEVNTGTNNTKAISPLALASSQIQTDVTANNSKATNATHTGEVIGSVALTIAVDAVETTNILDATIDEADLNASINASLDLADSASQTDDQTLAEVLTQGNTANTFIDMDGNQIIGTTSFLFNGDLNSPDQTDSGFGAGTARGALRFISGGVRLSDGSNANNLKITHGTLTADGILNFTDSDVTWKGSSLLGGDVTAAANLGDNLLIRGDGAGKGVQNTGITIDDSDAITGVSEITAGTGEIPIYHMLGDVLITSVLTGGFLTVNGGDATKFDISDGAGSVVDQFTDHENPAFDLVEWTGLTAITPTFAATEVTYVGINSSGTVVQQATAFTPAQERDIITLGIVATVGGTNITSITDISSSDASGYTVDDLVEALGSINIYGNNFNAASTNLTIRKEAGETFDKSSNRSNDVKNPNRKTDAVQNPITFLYGYSDGAGSFTLVASQTNIDPDQYDDGSGTLAAVSNNRWTNQTVYWFAGSEVALVQYGSAIYNSLADAESAAITQAPLDVFNDPTALASIRTVISVKKGETDLSSSDTDFTDTGKFGFGGGSGGAGGGTFQDLQDTYNNSVTPEILTDATRGAFTVKRGSAADTDNVIEVLNGSDTETFAVDGNGAITTSSTVDGIDINTDVTANTAKVTNATHTSEVTGATALTIASGVVDTDNITDATILETDINGTNAPTDNYLLTYNSAGTNFTWVDPTTVGGSSLPVADGTSIVEGSSDATKEMRIEVDTNVPTGTVVVLTAPTANLDLDEVIIEHPENASNAHRLFVGTQAEYDAATILATDVSIISDAKTTYYHIIPITAQGSDIAVATDVTSFFTPIAITITDVWATLSTAPTGSVATFDINDGGTTILSTKITIDATEKTSDTAATPPVISDTAIAAFGEINIDVDGIGSTISGATGTVIIAYTID